MSQTNGSSSNGLQQATLGGGCFWCLEAVYVELRGVTKVVSGYTGGHVANPVLPARVQWEYRARRGGAGHI